MFAQANLPRASVFGRRLLFGIVAGLWTASLFMPAVELASGEVYSGWSLLVQGWQAVRFGILSWFSNPFFILAVIAGVGGFRRTALVISGVGLVLALTSFAVVPIARDAGLPLPEIRLAYGFYLWLFAQGALLVSATVAVFVHQNVAKSAN